jgi:trehalose-phosphatase
MLPTERFRLLGGKRFLEVAPTTGHKGQSMEWLLDQPSFACAIPVYFGDDDKEEEAFPVVRQRGGIPITLASARGPTQTLARLPSPDARRGWLELLC